MAKKKTLRGNKAETTSRRKSKQTNKHSAKTKSSKTTVAKPRRLKGPVPRILESPSYSGSPKKLPRDTYPEDATAKDFACFGPPATTDGQFDEVRICDMGCFQQDGKDSNKYYHGAIVQHKKSKNWFTYFEWGRTGAKSRSFQFIACANESDARKCFAKQLHAKNDRRGEWVTIAGIRTLRAKSGKDCYLVRPMATRTTGLPEAKKIKTNVRSQPKAKSLRTSSTACDAPTLKLLRDMRRATIKYTRESMADSSIPTQNAVDQARSILGEAQEHVAAIDDDIETQASDKKLHQLTRLMYSRIPKKKPVGAAKKTWVLTQANIQSWHDDLDAFESALHAVDIELNPNVDILAEMNLDMHWIAPESTVGKFLTNWWPNASRGAHPKMDEMTITNIWQLNQLATSGNLAKAQDRILKRKVNLKEKPEFRPRARLDLPAKVRKAFKESNTVLLFHGTRSVNVNAILRESLRLPNSLVSIPLTGARFGTGIYFADDWQKSANYTNAKGSTEAGTSGRVRGRKAFMFAADVALGNPYVASELQGFTKPPRGYHSVFGKAGVSGVDDNEFIVYKPDQVKLRYLVEFYTQ